MTDTTATWTATDQTADTARDASTPTVARRLGIVAVTAAQAREAVEMLEQQGQEVVDQQAHGGDGRRGARRARPRRSGATAPARDGVKGLGDAVPRTLRWRNDNFVVRVTRGHARTVHENFHCLFVELACDRQLSFPASKLLVTRN